MIQLASNKSEQKNQRQREQVKAEHLVCPKPCNPVPKANEVLIKVKAAGICASDISALKGTHTYRIPPVVTGHELSGEIVKLGDGVDTLNVGERVAVEPHIGCGSCFFCRKGDYNECPQKRLIGAGAGVIFKGSGFYETDYRSEGYKKAQEGEKKKSEKDTGKKDTKTKEAKTKESKREKKGKSDKKDKKKTA